MALLITPSHIAKMGKNGTIHFIPLAQFCPFEKINLVEKNLNKTYLWQCFYLKSWSIHCLTIIKIFTRKLFNMSSEINVYYHDKKHEGYIKFQVRNVCGDTIEDATLLPHNRRQQREWEVRRGMVDLLALYTILTKKANCVILTPEIYCSSKEHTIPNPRIWQKGLHFLYAYYIVFVSYNLPLLYILTSHSVTNTTFLLRVHQIFVYIAKQ